MNSGSYGRGDINDLLTSNPSSYFSGGKTTVLSSNTNREKKPIDIKKKEDDKKGLTKKNNSNNPEKVGANNNGEKNGPKDSNKNEKDKNIINKPNKNDDYNEYINDILSSKKTKLLTNYQYVSLENKIGENSCFVNVIIHFLYLFPCVNDYLIRRYQKEMEKIEKETKKKEENKKEKEKNIENSEQNKDGQKDEDRNQNQINEPKNTTKPKEKKEQKENNNDNDISMTGSSSKDKNPTPKDPKEKKTKTPKKKGDSEQFLFQLGKILNEYQNVLSTIDNKNNVTKLNSINLRKSLSISSNNTFKLNSVSDPIEFLIYILDLINTKNSEEIHIYFHLKLIEEKRCTSFCPCKSNKQYDKDNFIYQIYVEEIFDYMKSHKFDFDEYKEKLFMLSYYSLQNNIIKCEKCNSPMNKTIICNNEQGSPKFLLINCVWNNFKPEIQDVITFLSLISLIEELDNLFICPNKTDKDNYYLMGIIFYSFTLCHYINMIFNIQENVFTLYNDEGIIEFRNLIDLYRYLTLEQIKNNNQAYFYPVLLVYGKENIYDENKLPSMKKINKKNFDELKTECKIEIKNKEKKEQPLTEEEKKKNLRELYLAQLEFEKQNILNNRKGSDINDYYRLFNNNETKKINIINEQNKKLSNNFLKGNTSNKKNNKYNSVDKNNYNVNRELYHNDPRINNEVDRILRAGKYDYLGGLNDYRFDNNKYKPYAPYGLNNNRRF